MAAPARSESVLGNVRVGTYLGRRCLDHRKTAQVRHRLGEHLKARPGWRLAQEFHENVNARSVAERYGVTEAMAAVRAGTIDVLLVDQVASLSRNLVELNDLLYKNERGNRWVMARG